MTWTILHENCMHQIEDGVIKRCQSNPEETSLVDEHGFTPLHLLCLSSSFSTKALSSLLKTNPMVLLQRDIHGDTPIHLALRNNQVQKDAIGMMISACPSSLSTCNKEGLLPLHDCCRYSSNRCDLIELVAKSYPKACLSHIKCGHLVKFNHKRAENDVKKHPEHFIADARILSTQKNNIDLKFHQYDEQVRDGAYPLHIALSTKAPVDVIKMLVEVGCSSCASAKDILKTKNKFGKIPMELAKDFNYEESTILLLNPGK